MLECVISMFFFLVLALFPILYLTIFRRNSPIKQFYNTQIEHILGKQSNVNYNRLHTFHLLLGGFYILRLWGSILYLNFNFGITCLSKYDFFIYFLVQMSHGRDTFYGVTFIMILLFGLLMEHRLYFSPVNGFTWRKYQDLIIYNCHLYKKFASVPEKREDETKWSLTFWFREAQLYLEYPLDQTALDGTQCRIFKTLSPLIRLRILRAIWFLNGIIRVNIVAFSLTFNFFFGNAYNQLYGLFPLWFRPLLVLDIAGVIYAFIQFTIVSFLILCCSTTGSLLYTGHLGEVNRNLVHLAANRSKQLPHDVIPKVATFLQEHVFICRVLLLGNRELWNRILFISLYTHVPTNVYLLFRLLDASNSFAIEGHLSWSLLAIQAFILLSTLLPLAYSSSVIHRASRTLPKIQFLIPGKWLRYKIKINELYERINSETKYGIQIGSTRTLTFRVIFEICLFYIAFILKIYEVLKF